MRYEVRELDNGQFVILDLETGERLKSIYMQPIITDSRRYAENVCHIWNESDRLTKINKGER